MNKEDIIYTAGFFDGEGHIRFEDVVHKESDKTYITYRIQIRIVNSNIEIINKLSKLWGGIVYTRKKSSQRQRSAYDLIITAKKEVRNFIEKVYPYLIVKKEQVNKSLEIYNLVTKKDYFDQV